MHSAVCIAILFRNTDLVFKADYCNVTQWFANSNLTRLSCVADSYCIATYHDPDILKISVTQFTTISIVNSAIGGYQ